MRIQMGGQVAIVELSARYHAEITKTLNFLVVKGEVKAKNKNSPVVVFGVLSRMVLVRES